MLSQASDLELQVKSTRMRKVVSGVQVSDEFDRTNPFGAAVAVWCQLGASFPCLDQLSDRPAHPMTLRCHPTSRRYVDVAPTALRAAVGRSPVRWAG